MLDKRICVRCKNECGWLNRWIKGSSFDIDSDVLWRIGQVNCPNHKLSDVTFVEGEVPRKCRYFAEQVIANGGTGSPLPVQKRNKILKEHDDAAWKMAYDLLNNIKTIGPRTPLVRHTRSSDKVCKSARGSSRRKDKS